MRIVLILLLAALAVHASNDCKNGVIGRYVEIRNMGDDARKLGIAEIEVFSDNIEPFPMGLDVLSDLMLTEKRATARQMLTKPVSGKPNHCCDGIAQTEKDSVTLAPAENNFFRADLMKNMCMAVVRLHSPARDRTSDESENLLENFSVTVYDEQEDAINNQADVGEAMYHAVYPCAVPNGWFATFGLGKPELSRDYGGGHGCPLLPSFNVTTINAAGVRQSVVRSQPDPGADLTLLVGILSRPADWARRQEIRSSWMRYPSTTEAVKSGKSLKKDAKWLGVFVIGNVPPEYHAIVAEEKQLYGDIVEVALDEAYNSLDLKVMHFFRWAVANTKAKYIMKVDDDTFVRVPRLLKALGEAQKERECLYWGSPYEMQEAEASVSNSAWYVPPEEWRDGVKFMQGGPGYVLSRNLAEYFVERTAEDGWSRPFPTSGLEDVTMGLVVQEEADCWVGDKRFTGLYAATSASDISCDQILTLHGWLNPQVRLAHRGGKCETTFKMSKGVAKAKA